MKTLDKLNYPLPEACELLGIRRTSAYREMSTRRLGFVKVGRRTLIPATAIEAFQKLLNQEQAERLALREDR